MKKIILTIFLIISTIVGYSQSYYTASVSSVYFWDRSNANWKLYQKYNKVSITIVFEKSIMSIQSKSPTTYKIEKSSGEKIDIDSFKGVRYSATELNSDDDCIIDFIDYGDNTYLISIIYPKLLTNLRYLVSENQ